jgi:hypothetical protein
MNHGKGGCQCEARGDQHVFPGTKQPFPGELTPTRDTIEGYFRHSIKTLRKKTRVIECGGPKEYIGWKSLPDLKQNAESLHGEAPTDSSAWLFAGLFDDIPGRRMYEDTAGTSLPGIR